jgi:hypothetical protein
MVDGRKDVRGHSENQEPRRRVPACAGTTWTLPFQVRRKTAPTAGEGASTSVTGFAAPPTISPGVGACVDWVAVMLRLKVLLFSVPLIAGAVIAAGYLFPASSHHRSRRRRSKSPTCPGMPTQCLTDDPAAATVRVGLPKTRRLRTLPCGRCGDADQSTCAANPATRLVTVSVIPERRPVIYLSHDGPRFPDLCPLESFFWAARRSARRRAGSGQRGEHASSVV